MSSSKKLKLKALTNLTYEDEAIYDLWLKFILGIVLAVTFVGGLLLIREDLRAALAMLGITLFDALLFKVILPRRYQIFEDKVRMLS